MRHIASKKVKFISFPTLQINQKSRDFRGQTLGNDRKKINFRGLTCYLENKNFSDKY